MESKSTIISREEPKEPDFHAKGMRFLTGGLTSEGDTFLLGAGAVFLVAVLYPLVGGWALLAFVAVPVIALLVRSLFKAR
jgi:hypothetical protein